MIKLSGQLTIRIINGRNGDFRVGRLMTEIGEFAVKDAVLDQYDEGKYEGDFGISLIYPASYNTTGRFVIEVRAKLETIALANIDDLGQDELMSMEQDPIDEERKSESEQDRAKAPSVPESDESEVLGASKESEENQSTDGDTVLSSIFGALWPLGDQVKLDPTVDRTLFRKQRDQLKALGYTFQALGQIWVRSDSDG